jgi:multiple sugar transport system permease protein
MVAVPVPHARRVPHLRRAFIITRGANNTETVSILGYSQLVNRLNLGLGSAIAILIFFCVIIIAFIFFRFLGASPERR